MKRRAHRGLTASAKKARGLSVTPPHPPLLLRASLAHCFVFTEEGPEAQPQRAVEEGQLVETQYSEPQTLPLIASLKAIAVAFSMRTFYDAHCQQHSMKNNSTLEQI
jgi:hypothetical protein